jgi:PAS domain-containing protein
LENFNTEIPQTPALTAIRRFRHTVLVKTEQLLDGAAPASTGERADARVPALALLSASLEELKVAEEELRETNVQLEKRRVEGDSQATYYRALFLNAPFPAFITDVRATILEINGRAAELFRREAHLLERKPLAALLDTPSRDAFRQQFARLSPDLTVTDWELTFRRTGDVPIRTTASLSQISDPAFGHPKVLYWALQVGRVEN